MRTRIVHEREGENMGPVNWSHPTAANKPDVWRAAEQDPSAHLYNGRQIIEICMYDGWPYWEPRPAVHFIGPIGGEWDFFNSYGCYDNSIQRSAGETP